MTYDPLPRHISFDAHRGRWRVKVQRDGRKHQSYHATEQEAREALAQVLAKLAGQVFRGSTEDILDDIAGGKL